MKTYSERLDKLIIRMKEMARPALWLDTAEEPGFSRLGGQPYVPDDIQWPYWHERPLNFIAQLDLAELRAAETWPELPAEGRLYFFYAGEWEGEPWEKWSQPWGFRPEDAGSLAVIYSLKTPTRLLEQPAEMRVPGFYYDEDFTGLHGIRHLAARPIMSHPSPDYIAGSRLKMTDEQRENILLPLDEAYQELLRGQFGGAYWWQHQLGGFPFPIQFEDMARKCQLASNGLDMGGTAEVPEDRELELTPGIDDWTLLLQLTTDFLDDDDNEAGDPLVWGMEGQIYFWIRKQDLAARDFSRVWAILQCT